ncbi:MAG: hypothetical protein AB1832_18230 [Pseudomonadota bacterium]
MRVLSNVELIEVSGAGWWDDLLETISSVFGSGSASNNTFTCTTASQTNGSTSSQTMACSNGVTTVTTIGNGYVTTTTIAPGANFDGSLGYRYIGGQVEYTAAPRVTTSTVMNGTTTQISN